MKASAHFGGTKRRFGGGMRCDSKAAGGYFRRYREIREFFIVAVETGLRAWTDLRDLQWSSVDFATGLISRDHAEDAARSRNPDFGGMPRGGVLRQCQMNDVASVYVFASGRRFSPTLIRRAFLLVCCFELDASVG